MADLSPVIAYKIGGLLYPRFRYGEEPDWKVSPDATCHDCATVVGSVHDVGCDMERCPKCERQFISCPCHRSAEKVSHTEMPMRLSLNLESTEDPTWEMVDHALQSLPTNAGSCVRLERGDGYFIQAFHEGAKGITVDMREGSDLRWARAVPGSVSLESIAAFFRAFHNGDLAYRSTIQWQQPPRLLPIVLTVAVVVGLLLYWILR